jgi:hypothetical protein
MRSKWLDWPRVPELIEKNADTEPTKPTKPGFAGFVGPSVDPLRNKRGRGSLRTLPVSDPYAERMRAALRQIDQPGYPSGMVPWLRTARPDLYAELTSYWPDEIQRLWSEHAPLDEFEIALERLVCLHRHCCNLYRATQMKGFPCTPL